MEKPKQILQSEGPAMTQQRVDDLQFSDPPYSYSLAEKFWLSEIADERRIGYITAALAFGAGVVFGFGIHFWF